MLKNLSLLLILALLSGITTGAYAAFDTSAKQAIAVDFQTGAVLMEKNADERMPTSSMSKVMTMYAVFDALKNGKIKLDDTLTVSEKAWRMGGSKMFVELGNAIPVQDLIRGVVVQSGNDATVVLAEGLAGSEVAFSEAITKMAHELGMKNSNFMNASGWPDDNHYSTARDLSILARALISNFPEQYKYFSEKEYKYHNINQHNRNPLLYRNVGADGIKTGHTEAAGYGLIGSATNGKRRVVIVVNGLEDEKVRAEEATRFIEWALRSFENKELLKAEQPFGSANVALGTKREVPMMVKSDLLVTSPAFAQEEVSIVAKIKEPLVAPVQKGAQIGTLLVKVPQMPDQEVPLFAAESSEALGFFGRTFEKLKYLISPANSGARS